MKRCEFVQHWVVTRRAILKAKVAAGEMLISEAAMASADAPTEALRLWRYSGKSIMTMTAEEVTKAMRGEQD